MKDRATTYTCPVSLLRPASVELGPMDRAGSSIIHLLLSGTSPQLLLDYRRTVGLRHLSAASPRVIMSIPALGLTCCICFLLFRAVPSNLLKHHNMHSTVTVKVAVLQAVVLFFTSPCCTITWCMLLGPRAHRACLAWAKGTNLDPRLKLRVQMAHCITRVYITGLPC